jgi:hypothetical protein
MRSTPLLALIAVVTGLSACDSRQDKVAANNGPPPVDLHACLHGAKATVQLPANGCLISPKGGYVLMMRHSGALDITTAADAAAETKPVWTTGSHGLQPDSAQARFQEDGNLVIYDQPGPHAIWNAGFSGPVGAYSLTLSDSGNLAIADGTGKVVWHSGVVVEDCMSHIPAGSMIPAGGCLVSPTKTYVLVMRTGGSLDVAPVKADGSIGDPIWSSGSHSNASGSASGAFQFDGNLVIYDQPGSHPIWNSGFSGPTGAYRLELSDAGEVRIVDAANKMVWSSKTGVAAKT